MIVSGDPVALISWKCARIHSGFLEARHQQRFPGEIDSFWHQTLQTWWGKMGDETSEEKQRVSGQCFIPEDTVEWPVIVWSNWVPPMLPAHCARVTLVYGMVGDRMPVKNIHGQWSTSPINHQWSLPKPWRVWSHQWSRSKPWSVWSHQWSLPKPWRVWSHQWVDQSPGGFEVISGVYQSPGAFEVISGVNQSPGGFEVISGVYQSPGGFEVISGVDQSPGGFEVISGVYQSPGGFKSSVESIKSLGGFFTSEAVAGLMFTDY